MSGLPFITGDTAGTHGLLKLDGMHLCRRLLALVILLGGMYEF